MGYKYDNEALREARERAGHTQETASFEIGVSRATWNMWESDTSPRCPDVVQVALICNLFKIEPAQLVKAG